MCCASRRRENERERPKQKIKKWWPNGFCFFSSSSSSCLHGHAHEKWSHGNERERKCDQIKCNAREVAPMTLANSSKVFWRRNDSDRVAVNKFADNQCLAIAIASKPWIDDEIKSRTNKSVYKRESVTGGEKLTTELHDRCELISFCRVWKNWNEMRIANSTRTARPVNT